MFIAFIQKKGWLKLNQEKNYLSALWNAYEKEEQKRDSNFYCDRLSYLFFSGLNNSQEYDISNSYIKDIIGTVPYLNGGLFEEDQDDLDTKIRIPD